ncbi:MAG: lysine--tRNA ligase [Thermoplasmata archaeon]|nr:MAG: lysine--tRNA ligase [Thermoplasmata archaeon]
MHWADVIAADLVTRSNNHVIATGITPSGHIHVGNMREILTGDTIYKALKYKDSGIEAKLIYIGDTIDPLRKVYPFLDESYSQYIGMSLYEIPCPCSEHNNYAEHFLLPFFDALKMLNVEYEPKYTHEMYKSGEYSECIHTLIEHKQEVKEILEHISGRQLPDDWYPYNPKCGACKKITTTTVTGFEKPYVLYKCKCGYEGKADINTDDGKLPWRLDWPARWQFLGVSCEPYGKDHATAGGSYDTGKRIIEEIFSGKAPYSVIYEWIQLKGKGAMASSTGVVVTAVEMLEITPPEVLRFLMVRHNPNKHIDFDPGLGILTLVDELDRYERINYDIEEGDDPEDQKRTYDLSQVTTPPPEFPKQIPYRHLVNLVQIDDNWDAILERLKRTEHFEDLTDFETAKLEQRLNCVRNWLKSFAPENVKFRVQSDLPDITLSEDQKAFIEKLCAKFQDDPWESDVLHNTIYSVSADLNIKPRKGFEAIYNTLLGKPQGPRLGYFLSSLDKEFVLKRFSEIIKK